MVLELVLHSTEAEIRALGGSWPSVWPLLSPRYSLFSSWFMVQMWFLAGCFPHLGLADSVLDLHVVLGKLPVKGELLLGDGGQLSLALTVPQAASLTKENFSLFLPILLVASH